MKFTVWCVRQEGLRLGLPAAETAAAAAAAAAEAWL